MIHAALRLARTGALPALLAFAVSAGPLRAADPAGKPDDVDTRKIARILNPSLVQVEYTLQFSKGQGPKGNGWSRRCPHCGSFHTLRAETFVRQERPIEMGGFLLSPNLVMTPDVLIHPRFVKSIAVRYGAQTVEARPAAYLRDQNGVILELSAPLEGARAVAFHRDRKPPYLCVTFQNAHGDFQTDVKPLSLSHVVPRKGKPFRTVPAACLIVDREGVAVGMSMGTHLPDGDAWKGPVRRWPSYTAEALGNRLQSIKEKSDRSLLRVRLSFRSPRKKAGGRFSWRGGREESGTERDVVGILISGDTVLIPQGLKPDVTARLKAVTVHPPTGKPVAAEFKATLSDYDALLVTLKRKLPGPVRFTPTPIRELRGKMLFAVDLTMQGENRVAYHQHCRIPSLRVGWRRQLLPALPGESSNWYVFDPAGNLVAFPIKQREKASGDRYGGYGYGRRGLSLATYLKPVLADLKKHSAAENVPLPEEEENRTAWMGLHLQALNRDLARINGVSDLTGDGSTGALVSYVYPKSPAGKAGIRMGDILLRLHAEGQPKPIEIRMQQERYYGFRGFRWDQLDQMPNQHIEMMPRPWPSIADPVTRALMDVGFGKGYVAEFFRDGKVQRNAFKVEQSPTHFDSAPRFKSKALGTTVREITFELRRYFQMKPNDPGVIISKIEPGSKAAVAGLKTYEIVQRINEIPIGDIKQFEAAIRKGGEVRLGVKRMTKTRLVKARIDAAAKK